MSSSQSSILAHFGLDMTLSPIHSEDEEDYEEEDPTEKTIKPEDLLELTIGKQWKLLKKPEENLRCEIFTSHLKIQLKAHIEKEKTKRMNRKRRSDGDSIPMSSPKDSTQMKSPASKIIRQDAEDKQQ